MTTGQISSASLPFAKTAAASRTEVRGLVTLTESTTAAAPCDLQISLETFDTSTGVAHVYLALPGGVAGYGGGPGPGR